MDLGAAVRFLYDNNELILGVSLVLFLILTILILVRSVLEGRAVASAEDSASPINTEQLGSAIEEAVSKAMQRDRPPTRSKTADGLDFSEASGSGELQSALEEKEAKIEALLADLEVLKAQVDASSAKAAPAVDGGVAPQGGSSADADALKSQLADLQAKLAEYELFEEDISNVSSLTEENTRLKSELDRMRAALETAQTQVQSAKTSVAEAAPTPTPASVAAPAPPQVFQLDTADEVMNEYAEAMKGLQAAVAPTPEPKAPVDVQPKPVKESSLITDSEVAVDPQAAIDKLMSEGPNSSLNSAIGLDPADAALAELEAAAAESEPQTQASGEFDLGAMDTDKLMAEASELESSTTGVDEQMGEMSFDTDKLMAEAGQMDESPAPATPSPAPIPPPAAPPPVIAAVRDQAGSDLLPQVELEEDLLGEFQDLSPTSNDTKSKG